MQMTAIKKYGLLGAGILFLAGALIVGAAALPAVAQGTPGTGNNGNSNGSGMMGTSGGMMSRGMMGNTGSGAGNAMGGMMGGTYGTPTNPNAQRLGGEQVRKVVGDYLDRYYNGQGLAIEEIMEFQNNFYAQIKESSTSVNAFELLIDPYSGTIWPEYGPNMMWNTKYGHMAGGTGGTGGTGGGMMGSTAGGMMSGVGRITQPTANMPVNAQQAVQYAQQYLDAQGTGLTAESQPDTFYGYYTIHALKNGNIEGMLSVNGYTGQVWYHTWHGTFIGMVGN